MPEATTGPETYISEGTLAGVREAIEEELEPNLKWIEASGEYPERFMRRLGAAGGFAQGAPAALGGAGAGIAGTIRVMEEVAAECLSTGFCVWCQTVCGWYIQNSENERLKTEALPGILTGETLAATGLSNPMKHFSEIERIKLRARPEGDGGYTLNGAISWVSNVGTEHYFAVVAGVEGEAGGYVMALLRGDDPGVALGHGGRFIALEGSSTYSVTLREAPVPGWRVLASLAEEYIARIRPGFVLTQTGFGFGLARSCIDLMRRANTGSRGVTNGFLDDRAEDIEADLDAARSKTYALAEEIGCGDTELLDLTRPGLMAEVDKDIVLYCFKGARTSNTYLAMKMLGYENVRTYFGSWNEWAADESLPIEQGAPSGTPESAPQKIG